MSDTCVVHASHCPSVHEPDHHHIWPQGEGGPDVAQNLVVVCPTGHRNIHELIREYEAAGGVPTWEVLRRWNPAERALALRGWIGMTEGRMAP